MLNVFFLVITQTPIIFKAVSVMYYINDSTNKIKLY